MQASHLEFLVEEKSMKAFLDAWLPRTLPENCSFIVHSYEGKPDLLRKLEKRLRGYAKWLPGNHRVIVIVDCDNDDCKELKSRMEQACKKAGLRSRQASGSLNWQIVTRIAIEELEAWYFGDWLAVCAGYPKVPQNIPKKKNYRYPDAIKGGTAEKFEKILQGCGYYEKYLPKESAAANIGKHLNPQTNISPSFVALRDAIVEATTP